VSAQPQRSRQVVRRLAIGLIAVLFGIWLGGHPSWLPAPLRDAFVDNRDGQLLNEALNVLARDYYRPIKRNQLVDKGLGAAVSSLGDPYSRYFSPSDYRGFLRQSNPHLSGIGVDVLPGSKGLRIVGVFPASPAARAGLARGDTIVKVGSTSLANRSADFASRLIKGRAGTRVTLSVTGGGPPRNVTITRANIVVPVASSNLVKSHGAKIGDLRLSSFTDSSGAELRTQVDKMLRGGARGLILDLRSNGGGLLDEAVNVASIFLADGTVVSTAGRNQPRQVYVAKGGAISARIPLVVLVDKGTASAAEIVAGALKDRGRAKVVGTRTYGKGVFQEIETLSNGGALDITVGEYFTPSGRNLGGGGVRVGGGIPPDIQVNSNPHAKADNALQVAERVVAAETR
jgi:carboxyl-terminal processing protease